MAGRVSCVRRTAWQLVLQKRLDCIPYAGKLFVSHCESVLVTRTAQRVFPSGQTLPNHAFRYHQAINQQEITTNMALAIAVPLPSQRMVEPFRLERISSALLIAERVSLLGALSVNGNCWSATARVRNTRTGSETESPIDTSVSVACTFICSFTRT